MGLLNHGFLVVGNYRSFNSATTTSRGLFREIGELKELRSLILTKNRFTGDIPPEVGSLRKLTTLQIGQNVLSGVPMELANLAGVTDLVILPNPMSTIPYEVEVKIPISVFSQQNLTGFLERSLSSVVKRQMITLSTQSTDLAMITNYCPLYQGVSKDILAGCLSGIVRLCVYSTSLKMCHDYFNAVLQNSKFSSIGTGCARWRNGPRSKACAYAVDNFSAQFDHGSIDKDFAIVLRDTIFKSTSYAPCPKNEAYPGLRCTEGS